MENFSHYWPFILEIAGLMGGIATLFAFFLGPMFYLGAKIEGIRSELHQFKDEMHKDIKDFHGRLCEIEERNKSK